MDKRNQLMTGIVQQGKIESLIHLIRGKKVMLDYDLATLYHVETKQLKRAVRRNIARFPDDFMFQLSLEEYDSLRRQFGTLKRGEHTKYPPYTFTENGVIRKEAGQNMITQSRSPALKPDRLLSL